MRIDLLSSLPELPAKAPPSPVGIRPVTASPPSVAEPSAALRIDGQANEITLIFPPDRAAEVDAALEALSRTADASEIALKFSRDDETGVIVVRFVDQASGEIVQQIPAEAVLQLSAALGKMQGQLFNRRA